MQKLKISENDLAFLLELGYSDTAEIAKYEMAEMYGSSAEEIDDKLTELIFLMGSSQVV